MVATGTDASATCSRHGNHASRELMLSENYNNEAAVHCIMQIISSKKSGLVVSVSPWKISNLHSNPPAFTPSTPKKYYLRSEDGPLHQYPAIANRRRQHQCLYGALGAVKAVGREHKVLDPKISKLIKATERLVIRNEILEHNNKSLSQALCTEKKRQKRGKPMGLVDKDNPGESQFFSPSKVASARQRVLEIDQEKEQQQAEAAQRRLEKQIQREEKARELKERKEERLRAREMKRQKQETRKREKEEERQKKKKLTNNFPRNSGTRRG
ncbi:hypothetical protein V8E54_009462 [Elaphomyces granulatus]